MLGDPDNVHDQKVLVQLLRRGCVCHVIPRVHGGVPAAKTHPPKWNPPGIHVYRPRASFSLRRWYLTLQTAWFINNLIARHRISNLIVLYCEPAALWTLFSGWWGVKTILFAYGTDVLKAIPGHFQKRDPLNRVIQFLYRHAFARADAVAATSNQQIESLEQAIGPGLLQRAPALIRTGIDLEKLSNFSRRDPAHPFQDSPFVFFPRGMAEIYNHEFCLEAIAHLPQSLRNNHLFVFVARDNGIPAYVGKIEEHMSRVAAKFEFLSAQSQDEMFELYRHCNLVVMTPWSDGTPVSAMEAMFFGKPLILGPLDYDRDLFASPVEVLSRWEPRELALRMEESLNQPPGRDREIFSQRVKEHCDVKREMQKLYDLLTADRYSPSAAWSPHRIINFWRTHRWAGISKYL